MRWFKNVVKKILHRMGHDIVRYQEKFDRQFDILSLSMRKYLAESGKFFLYRSAPMMGSEATD